ncbi:hypothetical protein CLV36_11311 [Laceyella sediminis]|uniref:Uncharacterized protein n=1 Tax=Laceyella sediminis TaxID=573074 RepID=A0ABX5EKS7_9BACL|nr:hypothetical protein CLV36_11311 [Laceyella sediminis]
MQMSVSKNCKTFTDLLIFKKKLLTNYLKYHIIFYRFMVIRIYAFNHG